MYILSHVQKHVPGPPGYQKRIHVRSRFGEQLVRIQKQVPGPSGISEPVSKQFGIADVKARNDGGA